MTETNAGAAQVAERDDDAEEAAMARLISRAGARAGLPADDLESVGAAALSAWRSRYGAPARGGDARRGLRRWLPLAAALALAVLGIGVWRALDRSAPAAPALFARVERSAGELRVVRGDGSASATPEIAVGSAIETSASGWAALRLSGGTSLRVDGGSRFHVESPFQILLEAGAVYVDSGPRSAAGGLDIATAAGLFREIGTQYEVRILSVDGAGGGKSTRLRVREGRVELRREASRQETMTAAAGEQLAVDARGGVNRASVAVFGAEWDWVRASAPPMSIEGVVARRFLEWLAREEGLRLDFADPGAAELADTVVLHGSLVELPADEASAAVLASCGLSVRRDDSRLVVALRTPS
jgi:hypothetical protein